MTTIDFEEDIITALEIIARRNLTTVETLIKEVLQRYLQTEVAPPPPKKYSFIGI
jgi:predicted DNA-binding ribbon-helix-helix protein